MYKIRGMEWVGHAASCDTMINLGVITGKKEGKR